MTWTRNSQPTVSSSLALQPKPALLRPGIRGRHSTHCRHCRQSRTTTARIAESGLSHQSTTNLKKCILLRSPTSHNTISFADGTPLTIEQHAKYLGVTLSSDGSSHKDVVTRLAKARKHFHALHQFWRTQISHLSASSGSTTPYSSLWSHTHGISSPHHQRLQQTGGFPLTVFEKNPSPQEHLLHTSPRPHSPHIHQPRGTVPHRAATPHTPHPQSTAETFRAHSSIPSDQYRTELLFYTYISVQRGNGRSRPKAR